MSGALESEPDALEGVSGAVVAPPTPAVRLAAVSKRYGGKGPQVDVLSSISLDVARGEFVSLVGRSGCGKSTLLAMIGGLTRATGGSVEVDGRPVSGPQTELGFVFQAPTLLRWRTALDNVLLQAEAKKLPKAQARKRAHELLEAAGIGTAAGLRPAQLSGGMQQRVGICRALLHDPEILLMDEPFSALDEITRDDMNLQLQDLWLLDTRTVIFVTHSIAEAAFLSDRVVVFSGRPARVALDLQIDLPRPRSLDVREEPVFGEYVRRLRAAL
jgi:NitT/TauT family transport system ATP-binding protein